MKLQNVISNLIRIESFLLIMFLLMGIFLQAQTTDSTRIAEHDVWLVDGETAYNSPGTAPLLQIRDMGNTSEEIIYLKFNLSNLPGTLDEVKLKMNRHSGSDMQNIEVFIATQGNLNWNETTPFGTNDAPGAGGNLSSVSPSADMLQNSVMEWTLNKDSIANYIGQNLTLVLKRIGSTGSRTKFGSHNATSGDPTDAPRLELKLIGGGGGGGSNNAPTADFTFVTNGLTVDFTDDSTDPDNGDVLTYSWNFGDGSPANPNENPTHTYAVAGTYNVILTVSDGNGGTNSISKPVEVTDGNNGGGGSGTSLWNEVTNSNNIYYDSGNVGIGTATPSELLHVAGEIYAVRVRVNADAGADFVFEEGYQLMTLEEVEAFVKKNKHLPEIPSEQEMIDNDLQLGDFSIKLLQKVEELTLYMIEMKKANDQLKTKNAELEKRLEQLEKQ